jgi:uncharacterized protein YutE (UPF0331/DUF86 family)
MAPLAVDKEKLLLMISRLEESLKELEKLKGDVRANRYALERLLQISVDESINIGNSIISELGLRRADTFRQVFEILRDEHIISEKVSEGLIWFVGLRNRLVHQYWKVEEDEIRETLGKLQIFRDFVKEVVKSLQIIR